MSTNGKRVAAYEAFKRKHPPHEPLRVDMPRPWLSVSILLWIGVAIVVGFIAHGIWERFASIKEDAYARTVIEQCRLDGGMPHVERAGDGAILGVRCDGAVR